MHSKEKGSEIALSGFKNEDDIAKKFKNWEMDADAQKWLLEMTSDLSLIKKVEAWTLAPRAGLKTLKGIISDLLTKQDLKFRKTDVYLKIEFKNNEVRKIKISCKKFENKRGYNHIDRRKVFGIGSYSEIFSWPDKISHLLALRTGALKPTDDELKLFLPEQEYEKIEDDSMEKKYKGITFTRYPQNYITDLLTYFLNEREEFASFCLKGVGALSVDYLLITHDKGSEKNYKLLPIDEAIEIASKGSCELGPTGTTLKLGQMTAQRKGGTPDPETLQMKIDPSIFININF